MIAATIIAALLILGGLITLGIPGAIVGSVVGPVVEHLRGYAPGTLTHGDRAWPTALLLSFTAPVAIPFGFYGGLRLFSANVWPALVITALSVWAWSIVVLFVVTLL